MRWTALQRGGKVSGNVVMVTGGSGFVGSHIVEALLDRGDEVHVFDIAPLEESRNLAAVRSHPNLKYFVGDLRDRAAVERFYRPEAAVLYHLASVVGIKHYLADPLKLIDIVVGGTRTLLELASRHGTKFIFTSTSEVYGKNPATPWREDGDRVLGPTYVDRWSYSSSKAVCEHMIYGIHRQSGLPFSIVRFFNVYGPRQNPYFVISQSVYKVLRGEPPLCYDDGTQTRCFTYVADIVDGILEASGNPAAVGEAFNLGNPTETSVREAIETVIKVSGAAVKMVPFDTTREYGAVYEDIPRRVPDVRKAAETLGWKAKVPLAAGLQRTIEWARENRWWLA